MQAIFLIIMVASAMYAVIYLNDRHRYPTFLDVMYVGMLWLGLNVMSAGVFL